jgi:hypothetical protein
VNSRIGKPEAESAVKRADAPGTDTTVCPASRAARESSGIRRQGDVAGLEGLEEPRCARFHVVLVVAEQALLDAVVGQQLASGASVLGRDERDLGKRPYRAERDVFKVADWGGD